MLPPGLLELEEYRVDGHFEAALKGSLCITENTNEQSICKACKDAQVRVPQDELL
jgi:hypothetical protein